MKNTLIATGVLAFFTVCAVCAQNVDSSPRRDAWQKNCKIDSTTDENRCYIFYFKSLDNNEQVALLLKPKLITVIQKDLYPH
jgi:hypothetical protein